MNNFTLLVKLFKHYLFVANRDVASIHCSWSSIVSEMYLIEHVLFLGEVLNGDAYASKILSDK